MNAKYEKPADPHTADAIAQRETGRTREDARRISAAWKEDKKRIAELEKALQAFVDYHEGDYEVIPEQKAAIKLLSSNPAEVRHD